MGYRMLDRVTPNQLTVSRILAVPLLMVMVWLNEPWSNWAGLAIFSLAGLTDYVDGMLARHRGEITPLGRMLDPLADKMLVTGALVMLVSIDRADAVPVVVILMREFAVSGLRQVTALDGVQISAARGAKWKTALQMVAIGNLLMHHDPFGIPAYAIGRVLLWAAMATTVWTGYDYFHAYFRHLAQTPKSPGEPNAAGEPSEDTGKDQA